AAGLYRTPVTAEDAEASAAGAWIDARSNDYLGLAAQLVSRETMGGCVGVGPGTLPSEYRGGWLALDGGADSDWGPGQGAAARGQDVSRETGADRLNEARHSRIHDEGAGRSGRVERTAVGKG